MINIWWSVSHSGSTSTCRNQLSFQITNKTVSLSLIYSMKISINKERLTNSAACSVWLVFWKSVWEACCKAQEGKAEEKCPRHGSIFIWGNPFSDKASTFIHGITEATRKRVKSRPPSDFIFCFFQMSTDNAPFCLYLKKFKSCDETTVLVIDRSFWNYKVVQALCLPPSTDKKP